MILELLAMPLARRILGAALVFAALAAIVFAIYHAGTHAGATAEASRQVAAGKASFERIEADVRGRLDAASAREQQLAALVDKLTSDSAVASGRATAAQSTAAADRARIAALSDSALRSDLAQRLGGVIPSGEPMGLIGPQSRNPSVSAGNPSAAGKYPGEGSSLLWNSVNSPAALRAIDARLSDWTLSSPPPPPNATPPSTPTTSLCPYMPKRFEPPRNAAVVGSACSCAPPGPG